MKNNIKKELIFFGIFLLVGAVVGIGWSLLRHFGVIAPPENPREISWFLIVAVVGGGLLISLGSAIITSLLRKYSKNYAIEEKDERNFILSRKAGSTAWLFNIMLISAVSIFCVVTGYEPSVLILGCIGVANIVCFVGAMVYHNKKM